MDYTVLHTLWLHTLWATFVTSLLCTVAFEATR